MFFSFISIYEGFTNNDKTLAGLGLFALSFWVSWFDPITRDISEKTGNVSNTFEEVFVDISATALLVVVILYTFFFSSSEKAFLGGLVVLVFLITTIGRFHDKLVQQVRSGPNEKRRTLIVLPALAGSVAFLIFRNLGGMAVLLGFLASTALLFEFECSEQKDWD
ncbi:hypothetical protein [Thermococcus sp. 21S9]|uniref:hypothetical protein n=1 Tax=Thermococcus sp. 21S9 TaxID=1638223 RepID=UPI00143B36F7|nr:hypothetical protein [Thermococcus sp. 21S9]